jgi:hypothetical protein
MKNRYFTRRTGTSHEEQVLHMKNKYFTRRTGTSHEEQVLHMNTCIHFCSYLAEFVE